MAIPTFSPITSPLAECELCFGYEHYYADIEKPYGFSAQIENGHGYRYDDERTSTENSLQPRPPLLNK